MSSARIQYEAPVNYCWYYSVIPAHCCAVGNLGAITLMRIFCCFQLKFALWVVYFEFEDDVTLVVSQIGASSKLIRCSLKAGEL